MLLFSYLLMSGVTTGALYGLVALGFVVVNKATGIINFAQGEFFMFAGFVAWMLHVQLGVDYFLTFAFAVACGFLLGCLTDRVAFRPIAKSDVISLVLATVGIAFVLKGLARTIWGGKADYLTFPPITSPDPIMVGNVMVIPQQLAVLAGTAVILVAFTVFFRFTRAGKMMQATADNARAATLVGIRTDRIYTLAFGVGAAIAEGATILAARNSEPALERFFTGPRTLIGDSLSKVANRRTNVFEPIGDREVRRGTNGKVVEIHRVDNEHSDSLLIVYLPAEKVLWTADVTVVNPNPNQLAVVKSVQQAVTRRPGTGRNRVES